LGELFPDFADDQWTKLKALRQKTNDPHTAAKYQHQLAATRAAYNLVGIKTSRATHGGRHAGIMEAESEGLDHDNLARMGRWNHDKMTIYYLSGLAIPGAFASAGFHDEAFVLDRDFPVPIELQRLVFPWIESEYPENPNWVSECDDIMNGTERSGTTIAENILATDSPRSVDPTPAPAHSQIEVAKYSLLHLLLHLRRVILQDAVMFINAGGDDTPLMKHTIFQSSRFLAFSEQMLASMGCKHEPLRQFQDIVPDLVEILALHRKETTQLLGQVCRQQEQNSHQLHHQGNRQQLDHETIRIIMKKQEDYNDRLQSSLESLVHNQERIIMEHRNRLRIALSALAPELTESLGEILMQPAVATTAATVTTTAATTFGTISGPSDGATEPITTTEPFQFSRTADTIQAVVCEFNRLYLVQKSNKRLGYSSQQAYRSEYRYINNRQTIIRELAYLTKCQNLTREGAIAVLQDVLDKSGQKIAAFQKALRGRQAKREEKGKALVNNSNRDHGSDGFSSSSSD
jgi:hypothetical protein